MFFVGLRDIMIHLFIDNTSNYVIFNDVTQCCYCWWHLLNKNFTLPNFYSQILTLMHFSLRHLHCFSKSYLHGNTIFLTIYVFHRLTRLPAKKVQSVIILWHIVLQLTSPFPGDISKAIVPFNISAMDSRVKRSPKLSMELMMLNLALCHRLFQ